MCANVINMILINNTMDHEAFHKTLKCSGLYDFYTVNIMISIYIYMCNMKFFIIDNILNDFSNLQCWMFDSQFVSSIFWEKVLRAYISKGCW